MGNKSSKKKAKRHENMKESADDIGDDLGQGNPYDGKGHLTFVVFGATGDLARKKLYPAFGELFRFGRLPYEKVTVIGYGRSDYTEESLWKKQSIKVKGTDEEKEKYFKRTRYFRGQYNDVEHFQKLNEFIKKGAGDEEDNRIFFLSVPPTVFGDVCTNIKKAAYSDTGFTRVIIEKPFGRDTNTFKALNDITSTNFTERQLYRIDHYLGKEVIMNFMMQRFANIIFQPMWNNKHIKCVEINWQEDLGTGGRGGYFDKFGIIRDIMQNHLLQVLMFLAMEEPKSLSGGDIVAAKTALLKCIPTLQLEDTVLGQYTARKFQNFGETQVEPGYLDDETVPNDSVTPTFALLKMEINNERWKGVPFIMKAGKGLNERMCEVRITFREKSSLYNVPSNELVMRIQPDEAIYFRVNAKKPGIDVGEIVTSTMDLSYSREFQGVRIADAYERAFLNCSRGDQSLFVGESELVEAWRIFTPLLKAIDEKRPKPTLYKFGSSGPKERIELLKKYGVPIRTIWEECLTRDAENSAKLKELFDKFSGGKDVLGKAEVKELLKTFYDGREVPEKKLNRFMSRLDDNEDGKIVWNEFSSGVGNLLNYHEVETKPEIGVPKYSYLEENVEKKGVVQKEKLLTKEDKAGDILPEFE